MKKIFYLSLCCAVLFALTRFGYLYFLRLTFNLRGQVVITEHLVETATRPNAMLFMVARNKAGVPVAVKKIINPVFPLNFRITSTNLIMPELLTKALFLEAFLNNHGELGVFRQGDIKGEIKHPVLFREKEIELILNTAAK
ncbi:MAG: hypothetical protein A2X34_05850 [Elusimicrobia bacterium GWC2_51_8]|nr:MAG: hypothetical protein A2X33_03385 [Elusimicrobia bacterium GWA2_51_34]OGR58574.1 MAG: hypothetical protein A2X34_05850 [Elusimicrobia bacterium GWC2_51_8]OGR86041.1 MAG: hypothetical protein A2021_09895 [Elusimicrobia bacterium GWF2_52_66]HAF95614.1 hypothetical protein [Elusimicrobiota bacterium]HCE98304.1 hypothetical protein [Elusimicrobiota bacterium]